MVGWRPQLCGHEFEQALEVGDGKGSLACCSSAVTESDTTELLNLVLQKSSKILFRVSLEAKPGPCPKAALLLLDSSSLVTSSPPTHDLNLCPGSKGLPCSSVVKNLPAMQETQI